ncbi:MAG: hypothetical protein HY962_11965 [Ignavibacteriae bacterium]|nr:hypothetical protein [Ignavibacteriota bacterium]
MNSDLSHWQQHLTAHFQDLASQRNGAGGSTPIFALEHGLETTELQALANSVRTHIANYAPSNDHTLPWIVYATELGYGYAGNEYWQTFEDKTPGWTLNGKRNWIRDAFDDFQRKFAGAKPSGPWAEQFSIIAWPITHAILPCDLQQQLARILYELRHSFSGELFDEPQRLGDFIAARSWNASARFQNLVQAPALVGQIAAALLLQGKEGFKTLLHPMTLKRIGDDVDRERRGRDWLRGARRAAEERAKIRGLTIGRTTNTTFRRREEAREEVVRLGIEPRLLLRPIEKSRWEISLEIPDLSHLLLRFPQVREILTDSRCTVAGAAGRPLARGRCVHGPLRVTLSRWPRPDDVLLKFEHTDAQLEYLLRAECMLRPGTSWLFKVASDGLAYESRGLRVRADSKYLIVSTEPFSRSPVARPVELTCQGVHAVLIDMPAALTSEWEQALKQFQVTQAKSIEVWPAGLAAVSWDGEGYGEWLASETPTLAIRSDHTIDELTIAMREGPSLSLLLTGTPAGTPIFVELPPLPVGLHKFSVAARSGSDADSEVIGDLDVVMRVREARPWSPGATAHGPLEMSLDPIAPSLEQLWEGKVDIELRGPTGRSIECVLSLFERAGADPVLEVSIPPMPLPLLPTQWRTHFARYFRENKQVQRRYDDARLCRLIFAASELGVFTLECERAFEPLRWVLRRHGDSVNARLVDDSGAAGEPEVLFFSFEQPTKRVQLSPLPEFPVEAPGGLFMARRDGVTAGLLAVPRTIRNFADLGATPQIEGIARSADAVVVALEYAHLWEMARSSGDILSSHKRRCVLQAFSGHIVSLLGGEQWARAERALGSSTARDISVLKDAVSSRADQRGIAAAIFLEAAELATSDIEARVKRLVELAHSFRIQVPAAPYEAQRLAELALRIASRPGHPAILRARHDLKPAIRMLLDEVPILARAARFLVIATDRHLESRTVADETYAGWGWSA